MNAQNACTGTHVAWAERGVHGRVFVDRSWLSAQRFQGGHLSL